MGVKWTGRQLNVCMQEGRIPREWMGVPEAEVRMVEGTYENTTARVVVGEGASEEFEVNIGLRQRSMCEKLDKENCRREESGETENQRPARSSWN